MSSLAAKKKAYSQDEYWMNRAVKQGLAESASPIDKQLVLKMRREYQAAWIKANKEKHNKYQQKYYAAHKKQYKDTQDRYWMRKAVEAGMVEFELPIIPCVINKLKSEYYQQRKQAKANIAL